MLLPKSRIPKSKELSPAIHVRLVPELSLLIRNKNTFPLESFKPIFKQSFLPSAWTPYVNSGYMNDIYNPKLSPSKYSFDAILVISF
jgi:hypothetical protein